MGNRKPFVAFVVPYPVGRAPSQRFRVENLLPILDEAGMAYRVLPFMDDAAWKSLYAGGSAVQKGLGLLRGFARRAGHLFIAARAAYVFVHREASPLGPPWFEWLVSKVLRRRMIFDFDDAIWIPPGYTGRNRVVNWLKSYWKIKHIIRWSHTVVGGNDYLCDFARQHNGSVVRIPTVVDTDKRYDRLKEHSDKTPVVVGWTGSYSTLQYLQDFSRILAELQADLDFTFLVIADKVPDLPIANMEFVRWRPETEIEDLLRMDIGVMPLFEDAWAKGKCGFKLIQYLAIGVPALATPIGVNPMIIEEGVNGYLCRTDEEWKARLRELITDAGKRGQFGRAGRQRIISSYSIYSQRSTFLHLFPLHQH